MITPCLHFDCDNRSSFGYCKSTYCINMKYNRQKIDELEPADVAPVRHGHWTLVGWHKGMKVVECSCCKKRAIGSTDFCPNCGAKMDGKGEE